VFTVLSSAVTFDFSGFTITEEDVVLHDGQRRCASCTFTCDKVRRMENHVNIRHKKVRPYACDKCDKRYAGRDGLWLHVRSSHGDEALREVINRSRREQHQTNRMRRAVCTFCGKEMSKVALQRHLRFTVCRGPITSMPSE
jgi:hypothetical protein